MNNTDAMGRGHYLREILSSLLHLLSLPPVFQQPPELDIEKENVLLQGPELLLQQILLVTPGSLVEGALQGQAVHLQLFPPQCVEVVLLHLQQNREEAMESSRASMPPKPNQGSQARSTVQPRWLAGDVKRGSPKKIGVTNHLMYETS